MTPHLNEQQGAGASGAASDVSSLLGALLSSQGRRCFRLIISDGQLLELKEVDEEVKDRAGELQPGWVSLRTASKRLAHSYSWMSRHWRGMGLHPRKMGSVLFFKETDISALIERQRPLGRGPGRPRKVVGIISTGG